MKRIIEYPERTKSYEIGDVVYLSPNPKDKAEFLGENIEVAKGIKINGTLFQYFQIL